MAVQMQYEIIIKENYPYLEYIFGQIEILEQFNDFYNVVGFVNCLMKEVENRKTREESEKTTVKEIL